MFIKNLLREVSCVVTFSNAVVGPGVCLVDCLGIHISPQNG